MVEAESGQAGAALLALAAALSFLVGAIPFGLLVGRALGLGDVRKIGSGNIGATNLMRAGGKKAGAITLVLDILKGAGPALAAGAALGPAGAAIAGLAAFLGHCFSPFLGFKGGKGVATGLGAYLAWGWPIALLCLGLFAALVWRTKYVSLGSLSAAAAAAALFALFDQPLFAVAAAVMAAVSAWAHRENIRRLRRGEESRVSFGGGK